MLLLFMLCAIAGQFPLEVHLLIDRYETASSSNSSSGSDIIPTEFEPLQQVNNADCKIHI